jgi:uncharacterized protein with HEPN domain
MSDDLKVLKKIIEWIDYIERYGEGVNFEEFFKDTKSLHATNFCLTQIGEEVKNVSSEMQSKNPQIAWRNLTSLRNRLAHDYPGIAEKALWKAITNELPSICNQLQSVLAKEQLSPKMSQQPNMAEVQSAESKASLIQGLDKSADGSTSVEGRDIGYEEEGYVAAADRVKYESQQARSADNAAKNEAALENIKVGQRLTFRSYENGAELTGNVVAVDSEFVTLRCGKQEIGAKRACGTFVSAPPLTPEQTPEYAMAQAQKLMNTGSKVFFAQDEGIYKGKIIGKTPSYAIQKVNEDTAILHRLKDLEMKDKDVQGLLSDGQDVNIVKDGRGVSISLEQEKNRAEKEKVREQQKSRGGRSR